MAFDRVAVLRQAEKLIRQGKLDQAIDEYTRVVDDQPRDWATANLLGDLLARSGRLEDAVAQFSRCADTLRLLGFLPKAAALYKKILNLRPDDEHALVQAGEVAAAQGLMVDARRFFVAAADGRRAKGDLAYAEQLLARLEALVSGAAKTGGARGPGGTVAGGAGGTVGGADRDPALLLAMAEMRLRTGDTAAGLALVEALVARHEPSVMSAADLSARLATEMHDNTGFQLADRVASFAALKEDWSAAAKTWRRFLVARPTHLEGLHRLAEICEKGNLREQSIETQIRIFDAHIADKRVDAARTVAEQFLSRHPDLTDHIERLRRALLGVGGPDIVSKPAVTLPPAEPAPAPQASPPASRVVSEPPPANASPATPPAAPPARPVVASPPEAAAPPRPDPHAIDLASVLGERPSIASAPDVIEEVDLSDMLDELPATSEGKAPPADDIEEVFKQLRSEGEDDGGPDAAEVAFQRGKALYEAGAFDDCIEPLALGARLAERRFVAATLLAEVFRSRKQAPEAVQWLGIAADVPGIGPAERHRTLLNLATLLEATGETSGALAVCLELHAEAGEYEDVSARIARLSLSQAGG